MLPEVGFSEMLVIGVVALLVVGPKDLPMLLRKLGEWTRKVRNMATDFRHSFDEIARQSELDELRKEVQALRDLNPINDIKREIQAAADMGEAVYKEPTQYEFSAPEALPLANAEAQTSIEDNAINSEPLPIEKPKKPRKPRAKKVVMNDE